MATIKQIAEKAGVSSATVSRVLNNDASMAVSDATRARIFAAAEELQYKPTRLKRLKQEGMMASQQIGLLLSLSVEEESSDPYFASIRRGIESRCEELGLSIGKVWRLNSGMELQPGHQLSGLIAVGTIAQETIVHLIGHTDRVVLVDNWEQLSDYDSVHLNFRQAVNSVVDHLLHLGHETIAYIGGDSDEGFDPRTKHFKERLAKQGLLKEELILHAGDWSTNGGYEQMKALLLQKNRPTACFIGSDPMAVGALRALHEHGVDIPNEMAIVGFDDIEMSAFLSPPLSTVKAYTEQMGKTAVQLLMERIKGREASMEVTIETKLIIRESCGGLAANS
ncbi:LacI family DNA-binding transcriptional regulator [Paenibacillus gorillae]|uniref:LacI family DNA-binding transcriptional regulator n=1 Tax=Paenibacillus gorillae TaxID=1243662 RepID=UPI0004B7B6A4|nr:LacI family DNA-binding transcriptional regulator [Paenibacillus gorillae]